MNVLSTMSTRVYEEALVVLRSNTVLYASAALATVLLFKVVNISRRKVSTTRLLGPPSPSFLYGVARDTLESSDSGFIYEEWVKKYGVAFEVPAALGRKTIMLFDPKALQHYYMRETWTYISLPTRRTFLQRTVNVVQFFIAPDFLHRMIFRPGNQYSGPSARIIVGAFCHAVLLCEMFRHLDFIGNASP